MTIHELEKEIQEKEAAAQKLTDDLLPLQAQLTKYITSGAKDRQEWYGRASIAYQSMRGKLRKLNKKINKLKMERKALIRQQRESEDRIQAKLFYRKLKELLSEDEFADFLKECEAEMSAELGVEVNRCRGM